MGFQQFFEEIRVVGRDLASQVERLIHEGNVRRIIIKDAQGNTFMEIPVSVATIGVIAAPVLAAVGTIAALAASFTLVVQRSEPEPQPPKAEPETPVETVVED